MITSLQITFTEESITCEGTIYIPEYPNVVRYSYKYNVKGKYPVYFKYNITPNERDVFSVSTLEEMEVNDEDTKKYEEDIKEIYLKSENDNYIENSRKSLLRCFENELSLYNQVLDEVKNLNKNEN